MTGELLDKYTKRVLPLESRHSEPQPTEPDDLGCFGWLRGINARAIMLELRKKDGSIVALGYSWLERAEFGSDSGITLSFAGQRVRITGHGLNAEIRPTVRLFEGIVRHRVPWICESWSSSRVDAAQPAVSIERVTCD